MVTPSAGSVILVRFPFSDLSQLKLRPAVVLVHADRGDWIPARSQVNRTATLAPFRLCPLKIASALLSGSLPRPIGRSCRVEVG